MLIPMPATREEWLVLRGKRVGASEVAALWDLSPYIGRFALWHIKAGTAPPPDIDNERTKWGLALETAIALAYAEENNATVTKGRYAICDDEPGLAASLDFEIEADPAGEFPGMGVLECKNTDWMVARRTWTDGEPPIHILLQLQAQLAASGHSWGVVACLVGGNDFRCFRYAARPALIADIKRRVAAFWASIAEGREPPVDGSDSAADVLRSLYPEPVDDVIDMGSSNEWPEAVAQFIAASEANKAAKDAYDEAKNRVVALLGNHKRGWGGGYSVNTAITPAKPDRPAKPGEIIKGRAETRRYTAKFVEAQGVSA